MLATFPKMECPGKYTNNSYVGNKLMTMLQSKSDREVIINFKSPLCGLFMYSCLYLLQDLLNTYNRKNGRITKYCTYLKFRYLLFASHKM